MHINRARAHRVRSKTEVINSLNISPSTDGLFNAVIKTSILEIEATLDNRAKERLEESKDTRELEETLVQLMNDTNDGFLSINI